MLTKNLMQDNKKFIEYSVENFVHIITEKNLKKDQLILWIKNINTHEELISKTLQRVDFAYKRINEPLEPNVKYLLILFPFGVINRFNQKGFFNVEENKRLGFVKKIKEYNQYSFIGLVIYAIIIILAVFFFQIN